MRLSDEKLRELYIKELKRDLQGRRFAKWGSLCLAIFIFLITGISYFNGNLEIDLLFWVLVIAGFAFIGAYIWQFPLIEEIIKNIEENK